MKVRYVVSPEDLAAHRLRVTVHLEGVTPGAALELVLPVWSPGSYMVREYSRAVRDLQARSASGTPLPVAKTAKDRWSVVAGEESALTVSYSVFGHTLRASGTLDVTPDHIYLNPASALVYVEGGKDLPVDVEVAVPPGWEVFAELPRLPGDPPSFRASNYDELVDTPFEAGNPVETVVHPRGVPHRILLCGRGNYSLPRLQEDTGRLVEAVADLFGELPVPRYTFLVHLGEPPYNGLEHRQSTSLVVPPTTFAPRDDYERYLALVAHEYFHVFNVKRIRPQALGPFDYTRENYTRMLWAMEGVTTYYQELLLARSRLVTPTRVLRRLANHVQAYRAAAGRHRQSLEEASFDAWIDYYRPYEETRNLSVSYYVGGALTALALDIHIRERSADARSLDDVLRHLWTAWGKADRGIPEGGWQSEAEKATGLELEEFFRDHVRGTLELDLEGAFDAVGLQLSAQPAPESGPAPPSEVAGYLGVAHQPEGDRIRVTSVDGAGTGRRAGLDAGDEIVALNGGKVTYDGLPDALKGYPPGETVELTLFRRGRLRTLELVLGNPPPSGWKIAPREGADATAQARAAAWLGCPWKELLPPPKAGAGAGP